MNNFVFKNPTKLIFGKGTIAKLRNEVPRDKKVLITFGGGSVKSNGVYEQVIDALKDHNYIEFWGIEPNPKVDTLRKAIEICKKEGVEFILAVGGGSVVDGTKLIAAAAVSELDAWELVLNDGAKMKGTLPFASVITLPATGSEMNKGAVISNPATGEKFPFHYKYPVFSILDPETTYSLPAYQIACGIADTFIHVTEQYITSTKNESPLMDRWSEGLLQTLIEVAPKIRENQHDYDSMATFMLCATMALNGFTVMGVSEDWATHLIGHELTALHGTTHGHTLVIVFGGVLDVLREQKKDKILQYGERVFGITEGTDDERIDRTIATSEEFFRSLGLTTRLSDIGAGEETIAEIERRFNARCTRLGECRNIDGAVTRKILETRL